MRAFSQTAGAASITLLLLASGLPTNTAAQAFFDDQAVIGGALVGRSELKSYSCSDCGSPVGDLDDTDTAVGILGGYRPNRYVAAFLGYIDLNETTAAGRDADWSDKLEADGIELKLRGMYPFGEFFIFADIGIFFWDQEVRFSYSHGNGDLELDPESVSAQQNGSSSTLSGSFDGTDLTFGFGAGYRIALGSNAVVFTAGWSRFQDVGTNDPELGHQNDIDLLAASVMYEFGLGTR